MRWGTIDIIPTESKLAVPPTCLQDAWHARWLQGKYAAAGPLWGETTSQRWIPLTKASDAELWCFLLSIPEQTVEQTIDTPVIWEAIASITTSLRLSPNGSQTITSINDDTLRFTEVSRTWMISWISQYSVRYRTWSLLIKTIGLIDLMAS